VVERVVDGGKGKKGEKVDRIRNRRGKWLGESK